MMYTLYDQHSGRITGQTTSTQRAHMEPSVEGAWPQEQYYISKGQPQRYPPKPTSEFWHEYTWDLASRTWRLDTEATEQLALKHRRQMFTYVDKVNPVWWNSMSETHQRLTEQYRKHLLDITEQQGYPVAIDWPNIPGFLRN